MLDIPPPLVKISPHISAEIDDTALVPSSDEEISSGWKLVGRDRPHRKTTADYTGMFFSPRPKHAITFLFRYTWYID